MASQKLALIFWSFTLPLAVSSAFADSLVLPAHLYCTGQPCSKGLPTCDSEAYGTLMTLDALDTGKPLLRYDGRPDLPQATGSVDDSFCFIDLDTVKFKFDDVKTEFKFSRDNLQALTAGQAKSIQGSYERESEDSAFSALLEVDCTTAAPQAVQPSPMPIDALKASCVACHGDNGVSTVPGVPNIGGQKQQALVDALRLYKIGARNDFAMSVMNSLAQGLVDQDIQTISTYFSQMSLPAPVASAPAPNPPRYAENCCACHSANGQLINYSYAGQFLAGQTKDYLAAQIAYFVNGVRTDYLMRYIIKQYSPDELDAFADYFAKSTSQNVCANVNP